MQISLNNVSELAMKTILDVVAKLRKDDPPLVYSVMEPAAYGKFLEFEYMWRDGKCLIAPSEALNLPGKPSGRSFLYRGQVTRHRTCVPTLWRDVPNDQKQIEALLALERFRVAELELLLQDHPFSLVAAKHKFSVDYFGLAQHYGIPTSLLDLTSNIEIAAFFAVAQWDHDAQAFSPTENGVGVLYRLDWTAFGPGYLKFFDPVGFGPGLRPARQHAWSLRLRPGLDFEDIPYVTPIEFKHSAKASAEIFAQFNNGSWLYPPDCLVSLVDKLRNLPFVTMHAIRHAAVQDGHPAEYLDKVADDAAQFVNFTLGIDILDGYKLQPEDDAIAIAKRQALILDDLICQMPVGLRLVRT